MNETNAVPAAQVLIVEDEPDHADAMAEALRKPGHVSTVVHSVDGALEELRHGSFDVIVTDLRMPESGGAHGVAADGSDAGMVVLRSAAELQPDAETIMVTAHGDVPTARAAFKEGAFDFIEKPLDLAVFRSLVNRAAERAVVRHEAGDLGELVGDGGFEGIIAGSEPMRKILRTVRTVAASTIPVLVTGESGTGKELIARAVHDHSPRKPRRFVAFNCAGQSESLLEDQLFGHVRGAYTGADSAREGVFEYADKGTLFLDEIGDMPLTMQAKLLRVLETGEVVRLGSNEPRNVDVRFVSATNRDLAAAVREGSFREDLYYRINGSHIHLPPLRDRRDDIPRIVRHAISKFSESMPVPDISDAAMMRLTSYHWPGNVRQLLNVVQNMTVSAMGEAEPGEEVVLGVRHIPDEVRVGDEAEWAGGGGSLAGTSLEQLEKRAIRETLKLTGGNREQTAKLLGIGERTLYRKLKEYGLR
ncbi:MAG TPA: sigma-54-dependent Fis family transcriptional regulator [Phycisphaerales bacterium]|nr:sigma-54-dependent Fis family transcriptional regulator [Phycisphaerales bacterium]